MTIKMKINTKLKVDDNVVVLTGADRGKRGKVLFIDRKRSRIVVEGINKKNKLMKANQENPKGGVLNIEFPVNLSNVMYFCEKCKKGVKLSIKKNDKEKIRACKKCGKSI